jgi:hypothetical protein
MLLRDATSEELCEALVRHLELIGEDVLEKNFQRFADRGDGENVIETLATVWVVLGSDADSFRAWVREWMKQNGYNQTEVG